jgi:hypothetical protein
MKALYRIFALLTVALMLCACSGVPRNSEPAGRVPVTTPDYAGVTIPSNIAPLTFAYDESASKYVTVFTAGDRKFVVKGKDRAVPSVKDWKKILEGASRIEVETYMKKDGSWVRFEPFYFDVAGPIDQFLSYRLIPPNFENFEHLSLMIRDLTSYGEREFYNNELLRSGDQVQCMNCHHFRNYGTGEMQIHVRQYLGGTMILRGDEVRKINMKNDSTISSGVYPAWHPTHNYIAYSTNFTYQEFHSHDRNLLEVIDDNSQLILYDLDRNEVSMIYDDPDALECFPAWAPDGRRLYFTSAYIPYEGEPEQKTSWFYEHYRDIRYDLCYMDFDPDTRSWGEPVKLIDAAAMGKSISLPRVSPDGRWLMFAMGEYGVFHIWHEDADLCLLDLQDGSWRVLDELSSDLPESYHSWSSTGEWVAFTTRRDDAHYTRVYFAHHNGDGTLGKPFALPMKNPRWSTFFMYSFNVPEFTVEDIPYTARELANLVRDTETAVIQPATK